MDSLAAAFKKKDIKALLFDLDDTLYNSKPIYALGLENAWSAYHKHPMAKVCTKGEFYDYYASARQKTKTTLKDSPSKNSRLIYFHHLVVGLHGRPIADLVLTLDKAYAGAYRTIDFTQARQVLKILRTKYKIAVVTNQTQEAQTIKLQTLDPDGSLIDAMITSESVGVEKPHPKIFQESLKALNCTENQTVMIGDDLENDIFSAQKIGAQTIYLDSNSAQSPFLTSTEPLSVTIQNLAQLLDIF